MTTSIDKDQITQCFMMLITAKTTEEVKMAELYLEQAKTQADALISALFDLLKDNTKELLLKTSGLKKLIAVFLKNLIESHLNEAKLSANRVKSLLKALVDLLIYHNDKEIEASIMKIISDILNLNPAAFSDNDNSNDNSLIQYSIQLELSKYLSETLPQQSNSIDNYTGMTLLLNKMIVSFKPYIMKKDKIDYVSVISVQLNSIDYIVQQLTNKSLNESGIVSIKNVITYIYCLITNLSPRDNSQLRKGILQKYQPLIEQLINAYDSFNISQYDTINVLKETIIQLLTLIIKTYPIEDIGHSALTQFIQTALASLFSIIQLHGKRLNDIKSTPSGVLVYHLIIFLSNGLVMRCMKQVIEGEGKKIVIELIVPFLLALENSLLIRNEGEEFYYEFNDSFTKQCSKSYQAAIARLLSELVNHYPEMFGYVASLVLQMLQFVLNSNNAQRARYEMLNDKDIVSSMNSILSMPSHSVLNMCLVILIITNRNVIMTHQCVKALTEVMLQHQERLMKFTSPFTQLYLSSFYSLFLKDLFHEEMHYTEIATAISFLISLLLGKDTLVAVKISAGTALISIVKEKALSIIYTPLLQSHIDSIIQSLSMQSNEVVLELLNELLCKEEVIDAKSQIALVDCITKRLIDDIDAPDQRDKTKNGWSEAEAVATLGLKMLSYIINNYNYTDKAIDDCRLEKSLIPLMVKIGNDKEMDIDYSEDVLYISSLLMYKLRKNSTEYYALLPIAINYVMEIDDFTDSTYAYFNTLLLNGVNELNGLMLTQPLGFLLNLLRNHFSNDHKLSYTSLLMCIQVLLSYGNHLESQLPLLLSHVLGVISKHKQKIALKKRLGLIDRAHLYLSIACLYSAIIASPIDVLGMKEFCLNDLLVVTRMVYEDHKQLSASVGKVYVIGLCSLIRQVSMINYIPEAIELITDVLLCNQREEMNALNKLAGDPVDIKACGFDGIDEESPNELLGEGTAEEVNEFNEIKEFIEEASHLPVDDRDEYGDYSKMMREVILIEKYSQYMAELNVDRVEVMKKLIDSKRVPIVIKGKKHFVGRKIVRLKRTVGITMFN